MPRVLIVEDSPTQAQELRLILESDGITVDTVSDGQTGLDRLMATPFDLVLTDILLPGIDGYELCRRVKIDPRTRSTPVVLLVRRWRDAAGGRRPDPRLSDARGRNRW